jgi:camelysin-like metallo-endopeptidase
VRNNKKKLLLTLLTLGVTASLATLATFSAFTATTANAGNSIDSGTVAISDNDADSAMYNVSNAKPGDSDVSCITVTYTGSLDSTVKLYMATAVSNGSLYNLQVERGSGAAGFDDCTGFSADAELYNGALGDFQASYYDFATGIDAGDGTAWSTGESIDYRFTITQNDDTTANAHTAVTSSGPHSFTWEARNN